MIDRRVLSRFSLIPIVISIAVAASPEALGGSSFMALGWPLDADSVLIADISADGSVIVGTSYNSPSGGGSENFRAFRWSPTGGFSYLEMLPGNIDSSATSVCGDGTVVVGYTSGPSGSEAFRWTEDLGLVGLGTLSGDTKSSALSVSDDCTAVVGASQGSISPRAFRWTSEEGMVEVPALIGDTYSLATDVSANGSVVVGLSGFRAFRWTADSGSLDIGTIDDLPAVEATAVSADGTTVVGNVGYPDVGSGLPPSYGPFRWTLEDGMKYLGRLDDFGSASDVSANGLVVVGWSQSLRGRAHGFLWSSDERLRDIEDFLADENDIDLLGWDIFSAKAISSEGGIIVGDGRDLAGRFGGWVATVPEPRATLLNVVEFLAFGALARRRSMMNAARRRGRSPPRASRGHRCAE